MQDADTQDAEERAVASYREVFGGEPQVVAAAPGRVNLIGDHTDYSGGFVLPCAIDRRVVAALGEGPGGLFAADRRELVSADGCRGDGGWAAHPRGVAWALAEAGCAPGRFQAAIAGDVPEGSGLSSSAALEVCIGLGLDRLFGLGLSRIQLARLCQRAENVFVGVRSGIMDQYASLLCQAGGALLIDCRSLEAEQVPLPLEAAGLLLLVCDTQVHRSLSESPYNLRRVASERAAKRLGVAELRDAREPDLARLDGEDLRRARHVVTENARVLEAVDALRAGDYQRFGALMVASHVSLRDDYEASSAELDVFVQTAMESGAIGARLTGAGWGGCAIALIPVEGVEAAEDHVRGAFQEKGFTAPRFYRFTPSAGAEIAIG